jgi:ketosteroid isomerase-like protein
VNRPSKPPGCRSSDVAGERGGGAELLRGVGPRRAPRASPPHRREIEYVNPAEAVEPGTRRGVAAFATAVEGVFQGWETWQAEPELFRQAGDRVAVAVRYRARGRESGVEIEGRESALWTVRGGKVVRYAWFSRPAEAFEAAGLSE